MKKVIPRASARHYSLNSIESPLFAAFEVERALANPYDLEGLVELIDDAHIALSDCRLEYHKRSILERMERAEWLLVTDRPFKPLKISELTGTAKFNLRSLSVAPALHVAKRMTLTGGPGRWVTKGIEYDTARNAVFFAANWLTSRGDEGRMFLSEGKDYANTSRTVVQEWQPLMDGQMHLRDKSVSRYYGEQRRIGQQFVEAEDHWQISGTSWHWRPTIGNITYELKGE
ncbi:hypothetical protein N5D61_09225 [Pseudomonas sp. GD03842]|uniref:hypothetical protein n=1 Tax=unclassified Pseudomonas TaxID=196821 RepID=UPI000D350023|nr:MULTISPECIES: hypothetical protein [unclassified Pseudomonas]MDH0746525.1 hypothetical protein [Pseudomonas sp. GD03842]RAU46461.1 hypothetical protein DBP26_009830 [Pseudomonas sp. RIT 409]RAU52526.1 hypothetical protein DBY65_018020 [Pseudomonas sp. RIT 412]